MLPVRRTQVKFLQHLGKTMTPSSMLLSSQLPSWAQKSVFSLPPLGESYEVKFKQLGPGGRGPGTSPGLHTPTSDRHRPEQVGHAGGLLGESAFPCS